MGPADLDRFSFRAGWIPQLHIPRAFSCHARFPWANLILFCFGGILLVVGLFRAFGNPRAYRGKIFGSILTLLSVLMIGLFSYVIFYELRQVPASTGAPRVGQTAPDFMLLDQNEQPIGLGDLLSGSKGVVLIFYRGFW